VASAATTGVLVESRGAADEKIRGSRHQSATDLFGQAQILALYDPDRSQTIKRRNIHLSAFLGALRGVVEAKRSSQGAGLRILTGTVTSPTLVRQMAQFLAAFPAAKWHQYEASGRDNVRGGAQLAFGAVVDTRYAFDRARVVVSLDGPGGDARRGAASATSRPRGAFGARPADEPHLRRRVRRATPARPITESRVRGTLSVRGSSLRRSCQGRRR
jgi:hypothetical protein